MVFPGENITMLELDEATNNLICSHNKGYHHIVDNDAVPDFVPTTSLPVLPMSIADDEYAKYGAKHIIDVICDYQHDVPKDALVELSKQKRIGEAPEPFNNKSVTEASHYVSIFAIRQANGLTTIMRHLVFDSKQKLPLLKSLCHGTPYKLDWATLRTPTRSQTKVWQHMLEGLPGFHMRAFSN